MGPAMVATTVWLHDSGEMGLVSIKQTAQEGSAAHPEHDWAESKTGGATVKRLDVHSNHGGASDDDGDVLVTVMNKRTN